MIVKFWRWLCEEPIDHNGPTIMEESLSERILFLETELSKSYRRYAALTNRLREFSQGFPSQQSQPVRIITNPETASDPISLRGHKPLAVRRAELERLSAERAKIEVTPEVKFKEKYWGDKVRTDQALQEEKLFEELAELEDANDGQSERAAGGE